MANLSEPNYEYWCKMDEWPFKDAALLLNGLDPLDYRPVKFNLNEVPAAPELKEVYLTFLILKAYRWETGRMQINAHPLDIYIVAKNKSLSIPQALEICLEREIHHARFIEETVQPQSEMPNQKATEELSPRERDNLLKAIGLFISLLAENFQYREKIVLSGRINASQVTQLLLEKAESMSINPQGIKSLSRKIKNALEILEEEKV